MLSTMISALSELLANIFKYKTVKTEHQAESEIIEDKNDYKHAYKKLGKLTDQIIKIANNYKDEMNWNDKRQFNNYVDDLKCMRQKII